MAIRNVGVLGCGLMGSGIAQVTAQAGFPTVVAEASQELLDRGLAGLRKSLDALVAKAKLELNWKGGDDIQKIVEKIFTTPQAQRDRLKQIVNTP